jgi:hypothetical protein
MGNLERGLGILFNVANEDLSHVSQPLTHVLGKSRGFGEFQQR